MSAPTDPVGHTLSTDLPTYETILAVLPSADLNDAACLARLRIFALRRSVMHRASLSHKERTEILIAARKRRIEDRIMMEGTRGFLAGVYVIREKLVAGFPGLTLAHHGVEAWKFYAIKR